MKKGEGTVREKEVKAVLFDMDGVLVDSLDAWLCVFNDTRRCFGLMPVPKKEFIRDFGAPIEHDVKKYFHGKTIKEVEDVYNSKFRQSIEYIKLFPESISVLKILEKYNIKVGLITNSTRFITLAILNHFNLKKYFDVVVTMDDVKKRKPAPDMVLKACKTLKVMPKNTILVGDTMNDIIAGRRAGCVTVGYKVKGDYRIDDLDEIVDIVDRWNIWRFVGAWKHIPNKVIEDMKRDIERMRNTPSKRIKRLMKHF